MQKMRSQSAGHLGMLGRGGPAWKERLTGPRTSILSFSKSRELTIRREEKL